MCDLYMIKQFQNLITILKLYFTETLQRMWILRAIVHLVISTTINIVIKLTTMSNVIGITESW